MNTSNLLKKISFLALTASSLCFTTETFAQHGRRDRREDVRDHRENKRDRKEDVRDRREDNTMRSTLKTVGLLPQQRKIYQS